MSGYLQINKTTASNSKYGIRIRSHSHCQYSHSTPRPESDIDTSACTEAMSQRAQASRSCASSNLLAGNPFLRVFSGP